jgi:5-dehydro-4-deoxyglucarate dehydratase
MPFVPTPFRAADQTLDLAGLRGNLRFLLAHETRILGMAGFAGEFAALTLDEYAQVIEVAVAEAAGRALVVAGVGHGTQTAIEFAQRAEAAGADCVMLLPPFVADPPAEGLYQHLRAIAQSVQVAVMLHSLPGGAVLTPETIARLAELPNVVAYKDELRDIRSFHDIRARVGDRLVYVTANGEKLLRYYFMDGPGVLATAMGNFDPVLINRVYQLAATGETAELNQVLQTKIAPWYALRERDRAYLIAVTKETMNLLGLCGGVPRWPLWPMNAADRPALLAILADLGYAVAG